MAYSNAIRRSNLIEADEQLLLSEALRERSIANVKRHVAAH